MDISELKALLEKEASKPGGYDFMKDAKKIIAGNFPARRRMLRKIAIEGALMMCAAFACGWLHSSLPYKSWWITIVVTAFSAMFLTLEVMAFRVYWKTPFSSAYVESVRKFSERLHAVTNPMKILNVCLALFIIILILIDTNVVSILTWKIVVLLLCIQVGTGLFSRRWIAYAKNARRNARAYQKFDNL